MYSLNYPHVLNRDKHLFFFLKSSEKKISNYLVSTVKKYVNARLVFPFAFTKVSIIVFDKSFFVQPKQMKVSPEISWVPCNESVAKANHAVTEDAHGTKA